MTMSFTILQLPGGLLGIYVLFSMILLNHGAILGHVSMKSLSVLSMNDVSKNDPLKDSNDIGLSRRKFLKTIGVASVMTVSSTPVSARAQMSSSIVTSKESASQEGISGFVAGAAVSASKTIIKYPLDTASVRLQMPNTAYSVARPLELFSESFRGAWLPLLSNVPGGAIFFAVKDASKSALISMGIPKWIATSLAVAIAQPPYWLARNPSEVIKTRQQAGLDGYGRNVSAIDAIQKIVTNATSNEDALSTKTLLSEFYSGYFENMAYAYPADVIKFLVYDKLSGGKRKNLPPAEGAVYGAISTAAAQLITTPLDVVRYVPNSFIILF